MPAPLDPELPPDVDPDPPPLDSDPPLDEDPPLDSAPPPDVDPGPPLDSEPPLPDPDPPDPDSLSEASSEVPSVPVMTVAVSMSSWVRDPHPSANSAATAESVVTVAGETLATRMRHLARTVRYEPLLERQRREGAATEQGNNPHMIKSYINNGRLRKSGPARFEGVLAGTPGSSSS